MSVAMPPMQEERPQAPRAAVRPTTFATPILDVRRYNFWYGITQALFDLSLTVPRQAVTALIGPSGCGKSTFLRSINRLNELIPHTRHTGDILLEGVSVFSRGTDPVALRQVVGMVFQQPNPFPKSIFDNVAYGPRINALCAERDMPERVERALRRAALWTKSRIACRLPAPACRAGSNSVCASPARSPTSPKCSSWTSRARRSIRPRRSASRSSWWSSNRRSAS